MAAKIIIQSGVHGARPTGIAFRTSHKVFSELVISVEQRLSLNKDELCSALPTYPDPPKRRIFKICLFVGLCRDTEKPDKRVEMP